MHELAIAESIVKTVLQEAVKREAVKITAVGMKIGVLTDIVPDALEFGFEAITKDTLLEGAILNIEKIDISGKCQDCNKEIVIENFVFKCPFCKKHNISVEKGNELDISYIDIEYDDNNEK